MIVLDTHVWLWAISEPELLSSAAGDAIASAREVAISAISIWEVALLADRGRIRLPQSVSSWVRDALTSDTRTREIPVDGGIAVAAVALRGRGLPGDPADQVIFATAEHLGARLITKDRRLRKFAPEITLW
jgi:PIN domain nuclease of toxin-antitoxin system